MRDVVMEQMHEVIRMREQQRANMRLLRQREQQALRDFERANRVMAAPPAPVANPQAPHPPAPFQVFGNPQAVPEPLPFLDLVENHGRNIHIVQQQRMPFMAAPCIRCSSRSPPSPPGWCRPRRLCSLSTSSLCLRDTCRVCPQQLGCRESSKWCDSSCQARITSLDIRTSGRGS